MSTMLTRRGYTPESTMEGQPPIARLSARFRNLELACRKLWEQHHEWAEHLNELMTQLVLTVDKLENVAADLWGIDPPPPPSLDDDCPF